VTCHTCHAKIGPLTRADARYCSARCRVAGHRAQPPRQLRQLDRWVRFDATKRPLQVNGTAASSTNPATWTSHAEAMASTAGVGAGFVLNGDGIVCVDLDHCVRGAQLEPWAAEILADCPATFIERSVSGAGLHVWGLGQVRRGRRVQIDDGGLELYGDKRYIAVTGRRWSTSPAGLADLSGWLPGLI
jgi:primase-polymerase (primpol)-like protein